MAHAYHPHFHLRDAFPTPLTGPRFGRVGGLTQASDITFVANTVEKIETITTPDRFEGVRFW